ncbi:MAG: hypothetical protein Q4E54_03490 [Lachnospiraceae bacterium]|nr:hypothetical protein [Lachnospiraceae bacterium]
MSHSFGAWKSNEDGTHTRECENCGEKETRNCEYELDYKCADCGHINPEFEPECTYTAETSLAAGELTFILGGKEMGEYIFARSGNNWTIREVDGQYVGFNNNSLRMQSSAFSWTYSNGRFSTSVTTTTTTGGGNSGGIGGFISRIFGGGNNRRTTTTTTTYYLVNAGGEMSVSTSTSGSQCTFKKETVSDFHEFDEDGVCIHCGEQEEAKAEKKSELEELMQPEVEEEKVEEIKEEVSEELKEEIKEEVSEELKEEPKEEPQGGVVTYK